MRHNDRAPAAVRIDGARLRELRIARGFRTHRQLATALGCARSTVSMWEASKCTPRPDTLARLAALLVVDVRELLEVPERPSLRGLRTTAGLRAVDMAWALGIQKSSYCDVETGRQSIPGRWWPVLASLLDQPESAVRSLLGSR
ncbi:helix-turn-helix domain-containing protein [Streptomyces sp. NPDC059278]|uniref:helix-turn-helix domain-containing protein n=1 Tax=Streptomyces sp. NPDC059278 TaxID=3346801 RepID=UPI0036B5C027